MTTISTVSARAKLKIRREPFWEKMSTGNYLGFRKMTTTSSCWMARSRDTETGKQRFKPLTDLSHLPANEQWREAKDEATAWFEHLAKGGRTSGLTVREACAKYVQSLIDNGDTTQAAEYAQRYHSAVDPFKAFAGAQVSKLLPRDVTAWRKAYAATPAATGQLRSASTLNRRMAAVRAALNHALKDGYATTDHAWKDALKSVAGATGQRDVYLTRQQRDDLVKAADQQIKPFLQAACMLPVRPGALAKLTVSDFSKARGTLNLDDKTGKRVIGLPPATAAFFVEQCRLKLPTAHIFTTGGGKALDRTSWGRMLRAAAVASGMPDKTVIYSLRHSTITDLVQSGTDLLTVAQLAGTSVSMIQDHYGHLTAEHGAKALQVLS